MVATSTEETLEKSGSKTTAFPQDEVPEDQDKVTSLPKFADSRSDDDASHSDDSDLDDYPNDAPIPSDELVGLSECGYSDNVHEGIMSAGKLVHNIVGDPLPVVETEMMKIGDWFQEASYIVRDFLSGKSDMTQETMEAVGSIVVGDKNEPAVSHDSNDHDDIDNHDTDNEEEGKEKDNKANSNKADTVSSPTQIAL